MNRSFQNQTPSSGFVYFNTSTPNNKQANQSASKDTGDFLAFTDTPESSPIPHDRFHPNHCSSPQSSYKNSNFRRGGYRNYPAQQNSGRFSSGGGGGHGNRKWSNNRSFNNNSNNRSWTENSGNNTTGSASMSKFLHFSFTEDPWAKLEKQISTRDVNGTGDELAQELKAQ